MSTTLSIPKGSTLLLHKDGLIILRKKYESDATITTSWPSFVGTEQEVDAKVSELGLASIAKPTILKPGIKPAQVPNEGPSVGIFGKIAKFIKNIF